MLEDPTISTLTIERVRGHEHDTHLVLKISQHGQHIRIAHLLSSSVVVVVLFVMTECHHCPILLLRARVGVGSGSSGGGIPTKVVPNRNARSSSSYCHRRTSCTTAATAAGVEKEARGGLFEDVVGMVKHFLYFDTVRGRRSSDRRRSSAYNNICTNNNNNAILYPYLSLAVASQDAAHVQVVVVIDKYYLLLSSLVIADR